MRPLDAILVAICIVSFSNSSDGTIFVTNPARSAHSAFMISPVKHMCIAFALPMARVNRCVPPAPGMTPKLISG